ncbi:biopolymer transporter ExbD [Desulfuromonas sp. AOP6]|uniref:ExbD/TolR family protein n=1 Tax=Desulfuromonas sp. AOP6 TaxID=1566351 RepID=UPI00126BF335|nr:biopolymer transporter ExbD [Desulfuromonas sp. AOP6]BCA79044.1 biopolymer transporter ExbD [Desulfuromonas sp. AOP6]
MKTRRHFSSQEEDAEINMTPMLDIVFIMLIFFIVTTSFIKESGIEVNRPDAKSAQRTERGNILIGIRQNGEIWIDQRAVDVRAVRANVERLLAENPEGAVVIQADREASTGTLVQVMDQARLGGVTNISIAANAEAH